MTETQSSNAAGLGFAGGLALLFIALKLTDVIDWSWWWVLAPLWISAIFAVTVIVVGVWILGRIE